MSFILTFSRLDKAFNYYKIIRSQSGHSVLGSVPSVIYKIRFRTDRFQKKLETEHFGSKLFRFGSGSYRTNRIFLGKVNTTIIIIDKITLAI